MIRRVLKWTLVLALLLIAGTVVAGRARAFVLMRRAPAPGVLVDVGGRQMHLHCTGVGEPTVILESGLLDFSLLWARVQPSAAVLTRTCSYDRAGSGWSDASPHARNSAAMVEELRTLLDRSGIRPPYLLVGHSFGGMNARLFAYRYPEEVAGLILVDAAHEEQWTALPELDAATAGMREQFRSLGRLQRLGVLALVHTKVPDRGLPAAAASQYRTLLVASPYFARVRQELDGLHVSATQLRMAQEGAALHMPVVVISRGLPDSAQVRMDTVWRRLQEDLVAKAANGTHVIAHESGHDIHVEHPLVVVDAINRLLERVWCCPPPHQR